MATATAEERVHYVPGLAARFGVSEHKVRRVVDRLGLARNAGRVRAVLESDLGRVEQGLIAAGYLARVEGRRAAK